MKQPTLRCLKDLQYPRPDQASIHLTVDTYERDMRAQYDTGLFYGFLRGFYIGIALGLTAYYIFT